MIAAIRRFIAVTVGTLILLITLGFVRIDSTGAYNKTEFDHSKTSGHTRTLDDGEDKEDAHQ